MEPKHLLNLTKEFALMMKSNFQAAKSFHEKPKKGKNQYIEGGKAENNPET